MISMRQTAAIVVMAALGVLGLTSAGLATGNDGPPGQGPCNHGNSGKDCKPDPQPEHGKDCDEHGPYEGGVNEDHCLGTTTETTAETTTGTTTTTTPTTNTTPAVTTADPPAVTTVGSTPPSSTGSMTTTSTSTPAADVPATQQGSGSATETTPERTAGVLAARKTIRTATKSPKGVARVKGTIRVLPFTP